MSVLGFEDLKQALLSIIKPQLAENKEKTDQIIESSVSSLQGIMKFSDELLQLLVDDLRLSFNTTVSIPSVLKNKGHKSWIEDVRHVVNWKQWNRYKYYLRTEKKWSESVIDSLDTCSDEILDLLANPKIKDLPFDRRGLVMGYVQSGKTANFTAVINKAFDVGYKVIIVLAGLHNNLRSQTQVRLDEEVIGYTMKTKQNNDHIVGVGLLQGYQFADVISLTNSDNDGDFTIKKATVMFKPPILLVVKKNKTVLTNLLNYLQKKSTFAVWKEGVDHKVVPDLPLLIIDDEADQATVNTSDIYDEDDEDKINPEYDPSTINGLIRDIFHTFEQRAYVGYTATPFANMLIDQDSQTKEHGYDLFPRDFIYGLPKPNSYAGPAEYFSLYDDADNQQGSLVRKVVQDPNFIPENHKKSYEPGILPKDLIESIYAFLIATAIRRLRGQKNKHSSMLVHVTRFTDVQNKVYHRIKDYVISIKDAIRYGAKNTDQDKAMCLLYNNDFLLTSHSRDDSGEMFTWEQVREEIAQVLIKLKVKEINGKSSDILDYEEHKDGHYVLAIGGDKLSRGLTLDGLTVSYYLRTSKVYDTLMQMGRWFGYRDGYFDLCRIYTTEELANWFYHIAIATEELRGQLEEMSEYGASPEDYVLEISAHPDLQVTSPDKMRAARTIGVSYSASLIQTTVFDNSKKFFAKNFETTEIFIERLGATAASPSRNSNSYYYWENVKADHVLYFLEHYQTPSSLTRVDTGSIRDYIIKCNQSDELLNWTVVLINTGEESNKKIANLPLKTGVKRKGEKYKTGDQTLSIRILTSEGHEYLDYTEETRKIAVAIKEEGKEEKVRKHKANLQAKARELRDPKNGLLLIYPIADNNEEGEDVMSDAKKRLELTDRETVIGFAISFPKSKQSYNQRNKIVNKSVHSGD
ncbi:Z1 domain-containing protein [Paenibacillus anseongense]|uniref:Z1 domain-containing protein n=1 Tax=Paenibacillus anseongense TaxID=2682845 RepID=UPI002DB80033|nr:Z1 domain-containing protein [Paenibacillus anseongense]MEC0269707.1 Z1 domain-containing protein [Paenibacillus anseongense]